MKKLVLLLLLGIFFSACSEKNSIIEPDAKKEISFLKIPAAGEQLAKVVTFSRYIDGSVGGRIYIYNWYFSTSGTFVQVKGTLQIPAGAFHGIKNIVVSLNDESAIVDFSPSPYQFDLPLKLDLQYKGLNLNGIDKDKVNFYYISDDGNSIELIKTQSTIFNAADGTIGVIKAELNHFSRFGWVI